MEATPYHNFQSNYAYLDSEELRMVPLPEFEKPNLINLETDLQMLEGKPIQRVASTDSSLYCPLSQLPHSQLYSSVLSESQEINLEPTGSNLFDMFEQQEPPPPESESGLQFFNRLPSFGLMGKTPTGLVESTSTETLNNFFEDFPPEMIDYLEALPSSSEL